MALKQVVIFGNGAVARNAYHELTFDSLNKVAAFTVDREFITKDSLFDLSVVPFDGITSLFPPEEYCMSLAVGYVKMNKIRAERYLQAKGMGYELISYISTKAITWPEISIGDNCHIGPNSVVNPYSCIGEDVFIGANCTIGHDVIIGDHCFISDGVNISGYVNVGAYCFLGTSSTIRNKITIAKECLIGAGALILEDTKEKSVYLGKPAELLPISSNKLTLG